MDEPDRFLIWRYRDYVWSPWAEAERDLQWLVHKEPVIHVDGIYHWRWYRAAFAFRTNMEIWWKLADAYPEMTWESWGWWTVGRLEKPHPNDEGKSALSTSGRNRVWAVSG